MNYSEHICNTRTCDDVYLGCGVKTWCILNVCKVIKKLGLDCKNNAKSLGKKLTVSGTKNAASRLTPASPPEERERRSRVDFFLRKFYLFCAAMIFFCALFCELIYIPVYSYDIPKGIVAGWSIHTNRDTKIYVQPNTVTTIHEPKHVCNNNNNKILPLLIIVCSSTENFERRKAIRETWAQYRNYEKGLTILNEIRDRYKNYTHKYDLYPSERERILLNATTNDKNNVPTHTSRVKRNLSSFKQLLPVLTRAYTNITLTNCKTEKVPKKRFEDDDGVILSEFDMDKQLNNNVYYDYDYVSKNMKIPLKGYEDKKSVANLSKVLNLLKQSKYFRKIKTPMVETGNTDQEFQLVFLLGLPVKEKKELQEKVKKEIKEHGDIIQEGFIDSYNNLTLKSIMMLKWVSNKCNGSVRYILKADDDTYVNVPYLLMNLKNRSKQFDIKTKGDKEYLLIGDIITGAKPVLDSHEKWFTPRYMYNGSVYPDYLSGHGYVMSMPTAHALYKTALRTNYFHLEDIYITGMCASRASPRIVPSDDPAFLFRAVRDAGSYCAHARATAHRVRPPDMHLLLRTLLDPAHVDRCERIRLTKVRQNQSRRKPRSLRITPRTKTTFTGV